MARLRTVKKVKSSIFLHIFIVAILCMMIPLVLSNVISTSIASDSLTERSGNAMAQLATSKVESLEQFVSAQKVMTKGVAENPAVIKAC